MDTLKCACLLISILSLTWGQTTETTKPPYVSVTTTWPPTTTATTSTSSMPTPETTTPDLGPRCFINGECNHNPLVDAAIKDNADDCLSYCQQDEYCNWFSYDPYGRVCELFESCQSLSVEFCPQCVSGESSCEPRVCSIAGICEGGNLLAHYIEQTKYQCTSDCNAEPGCLWFSYHEMDKICLLFETCPRTDGNLDFTSGQSGCDVPILTTIMPTPETTTPLPTPATTTTLPTLPPTTPTTTPAPTTTTAPPPASYGQVLITAGLVGGGPEGEYSRRSEILDLKNGNSYCTDWSPYAHDTEGSFGAFVNNVAIVCGGESPQRDECYSVSPYATQQTSRMAEKRAFAASIVVSNTSFWITGGYQGGGPAEAGLSSSEYIENGISRYGPSLPEGHWGHAIAYYSYYPYPAYMLIGGAHPHGPPKLGPPEEDEHSRTTYIYYQDEYPRWAKGPELNVGRLYHAAGTIRDSVTNEDIIVVTGGERDGGPEGTLYSVELLFQFNQNSWIYGPNMPKSLEGHSMVNMDEYSLVVIGGYEGGGPEEEGYSSDLYMLRCANHNCQWSYLNQRLSVGRAYAAAIALPDSYAQCG